MRTYQRPTPLPYDQCEVRLAGIVEVTLDDVEAQGLDDRAHALDIVAAEVEAFGDTSGRRRHGADETLPAVNPQSQEFRGAAAALGHLLTLAGCGKTP